MGQRAFGKSVICFKNWNGWAGDTAFTNNPFSIDSPRAIYEFGDSRSNRFRRNLFFGHHPASEAPDPAIGAGRPVPGTGTSDFAGQPESPASRALDLGALIASPGK